MLNLQGDAILMDFGIVKIIGGTNHTATGAVVGTALYMSPEQIRGERPDHRADIYSLGVMLYEMAGGRPPFAADSAMTVMMMHLNDPVPDVSQFNPEIPSALRGVIANALAKDPGQRYQSAGAMATDLRGILTGTTQPPPSPEGTVIEMPAQPSASSTVVETSPPMQDPAGTVIEGPIIEQAASAPAASAAPAAARPPAAPARQQAPEAPKRKITTPMIIGAVAVVVIGLICLIGGGYAINQAIGGTADGGGGGGGGEATTAPGDTQVVVVAGDEATETVAVEATEVPTEPPTATDEPTEPPTETPTVTPTSTPEGAYANIDSITLDGSSYVVNYSVHNLPADPGNMHVHIFFDTVPPDQAGSPGAGPWKLSFGSFGQSPYTGYGPANRGNANQLCILIANANHTINQGTGNCVDLPEE